MAAAQIYLRNAGAEVDILTLKIHTPGIPCTEQGWISSNPWNVPLLSVAAPRAVYQAELVTDGLLANEGLQLLHKQGKCLLMELEMTPLCILLEG